MVNPHTSRSVKANRASGVNTGWQQVKINRNWSSSTLSLSDTVMPLVWVSSCSAILSSEASNRARRRSESIASNLAAETSHARGFSGAPSLDNARVRPQTHPALRPRQDRNRLVNGSTWREYASTPHDKRGRPIGVSHLRGFPPCQESTPFQFFRNSAVWDLVICVTLRVVLTANCRSFLLAIWHSRERAVE